MQEIIDGLTWPPGWFDGEIVAPNDAGIPDFGALQQAFDAGNTAGVVLYLFDLPHFDGFDLRALPLERRRAGFGSLLLGVHDAQGAPQYAGRVGSGSANEAWQT